jgi:2,3-dihydroxybiphenyl 1,2-dioxygenase
MQLGFLEFEVSDVAAWSAYFSEVLGLVDAGEGRFAMDGHAWRFQLVQGDRDDLSAVGWELTDAELDVTLGRLQAAGHEVTEASPEARGAVRRAVLRDPAGIPTELVTELGRAERPFKSAGVSSGFVADEQGLGHVVLRTRDKAQSVAFYTDVLGFVLSDHIVCEIHGHPVDLSFFHVNPRHHSLALGGLLAKRLHHFMLEARDVDDVGAAYDRTISSGLRIMQTLGRHPNDRMLSFYAQTPSGFQFELGWGGRQIDDADWTPTTYDRISDWGHHPPQMVAARREKK